MQALLRLVVVYRGVLLYGESGAGKSSLINAGLIPAAEREGLRADRLRVQPRPGEELVVERLETTADGGTLLPSSFAEGDDGTRRIVLSTEAFRERLRELPPGVRPLLIFDQFEELATLFEDVAQGDGRAETLAAQQRVVDLLVDLLRDDTAPVKLLLGFREDYLAKVAKLLALRPELIDQSLRLVPPETDSLDEIVRGPFEKYPGHFERELSPELAERLRAAIESRSGSSGLSLSEVQIACLRLWESNDPDKLFEEKGVQGLLEDYLSESLERFPPELRDPAVALLSRMVTSSGTRNVVSAEGLVADVHDEEGIPEDLAKRALEELEQKTKLIRRERRRDVDLYEIVSEFLLPWIQRKREERLADQAAAAEAERQRKVRRRLFAVVGGMALIVVAFAVVALIAVQQAREAQTQRAQALASRAISESTLDPIAGLVLANKAIGIRNTAETQDALRRTASAAEAVRAVLRGHTDAVRQAVFSRDGRFVMTADDDTVRIWDATTGRATRVLRLFGLFGVIAMTFGPDGPQVFIDYSSRIRNLATSRIRRVPGVGEASAAAFSSDGRLLAIGNDEGRVDVLDGRSGRRMRTFPGNGLTGTTSVAFSSDRKLLLTGREDGTARIWDERTGRLLHLLHAPEGEVTAAAFSPNDRRVVIASGDTASVWRWRLGRRLTLFHHTGAVHNVQFSHDGKLVLSAGDTTARLWDAGTGASVAVLRGHGDYVFDASFSPDDRLVVTASADATARLWSIGPSGGEIVLAGHRADVWEASFSPDGSRVVTASAGGTARIWNARTGVQMAKLKDFGGADAPVPRVWAAKWLPDGRSVVVGDDLGLVVWRPPASYRHITFTEIPAVAVDVRSDGAIAVVDQTGRASIRERGRQRRLPGDDFVSAVFSPDGRRLVTAGTSGVKVWDARTLERLLRLPYGARLLFASFSPDGTRIATASADTTARIWDASTGKQLKVLRGHIGSVTSSRFSPDGRLLVTSSKDQTVRVWGADTGALQTVFSDDTDVVWSASFSPDSEHVVSASKDSTARIYTLTPIDELRKQVSERLRRLVTPAEEREIVEHPID